MHTEYSWKKAHGHHYLTIEVAYVDGIILLPGYKFQVSIPPFFHKIPLIKKIVHDPKWLFAARNHDIRLKRMTASKAAYKFRDDLIAVKAEPAIIVKPAFVAVYVFTNLTRLLGIQPKAEQ